MPETEPTEQNLGAVFISYAREDLTAAQSLADALGACGVEVWFDKNELKGGDAWDREIREQIDTCALFVPIISRNTESRSKGYFRLEWKLAVDQTHLIKEGVPYLVPALLEGVPEPISGVPAEFRKVHWTRLALDRPPTAFAEQIRRLLEDRRTPAKVTRHNRTDTAGLMPPDRSPRSRGLMPLWAAGIVGLLAVTAFLYLRHSPSEKPAPVAPPLAESSPVSEKSIAVLPFENLSDEKENVFFTDGIHEDILTDLALLHELHVVSRTSVMQYRQTTKTIAEIGSELRVAYVLEGSVRRSGNRVRVTSQLINSRTDEQVWAKAYDRDITDIFAIQSEISEEIASALAAVLSPQEKLLLQRRPTDNVEAYDYFLKGRSALNLWLNSRLGPLKEAESQFSAAVKADPKFSEAWGELAHVHSMFIFRGFDQSAERISMADDAINRALKLAPDSPDVIRALADYSYYAHRDYQGASAQYEKIVRATPNDSNAHFMLGLIFRRQGHWAQSLEELRTAFGLDPRNALYLRVIIQDLVIAMRWNEAIEAQRQLIELSGTLRTFEEFQLARLYAKATGSTHQPEALVEALGPDRLNSPRAIDFRMRLASWKGDYPEFKRLDASMPRFDDDGDDPVVRALEIAWIYAAHGDLDSARAKIADFEPGLKGRIQREPNNGELFSNLSQLEAIEGRKEEALRDALRAAELLPVNMDALQGTEVAYACVEVEAWIGERDLAVKTLSNLLQVPTGLYQFDLLHDPALSRLRGDPDFEALVNDPHNFQQRF